VSTNSVCVCVCVCVCARAFIVWDRILSALNYITGEGVYYPEGCDTIYNLSDQKYNRF